MPSTAEACDPGGFGYPAGWRDSRRDEMAISEDTAALVGAQLTVAWCQLEAQRQGTGGLSITQTQSKVLEAYLRFRDLASETNIKHRNPPRT